MVEPPDPAARPSRLSVFAHAAVVSLLTLSFVSGILVWRGENLQEHGLETPRWLHGCLVMHGSLNPFLCA
jgi:hypothetical protein